MKPWNILSLAAILCAPLLWNACMLLDESCTGPHTNPKNIVAVAGNGQVVLTWDQDSSSTPVFSDVRYPTGGGTGENCGADTLSGDCAVACPGSQSPGCTITGLTNGKAYAFTVVTTTTATNPSCSYGTAHARSELVTPKEN